MVSTKIRQRIKNLVIWGIVLLAISFGASLLILNVEILAGNPNMQGIEDLYWWWLLTVTGLGGGPALFTDQARIIAAFVVFSGFILLGLFISDFTEIVRMIYARKDEGNIQIKYSHHVIIFGYTSLTAGVIKLLRHNFGTDLKLVLISNDVEINPFPGEVDFIHDNPISEDTIRDANVAKAHAAIILANDRFRDPDTYSLVIASAIEKYNASVVTVVEIIEEENKRLMKKTSLDGFIDRKSLINDLLENNGDSKLKRIIAKGSDLSEQVDETVAAELI